jgi:tripartite ATP-independent transporter DctP family solute receptor
MPKPAIGIQMIYTDLHDGGSALAGRLRGAVRMSVTRLLGLLIIGLGAALLVAGCGPQSDVTVIKLGHGLDPTHPVHEAMVFMADRVDEKSAGQMRIDIYPSQQLGSERQLLELLQLGSLGMTKVASAVLEQFAPSYRVLSLPYIFRDDEHRFNVLEGDIGRQLLEDGEEFWLRGIAFYDAGSRSFYSMDAPIESPADLAGLKIRTLQSASQVAIVNTLGGSATPISWGELYTALQQGIVDGAENNPPSFHTSRHYEVAKYYSIDEHTAIPDVLLISTIIWDTLTEQEQLWLTDSANESAQHQKELWRVASEEALRIVQEAGVKVVYPDKEPFVAGVQPLYEAFREEPEMYKLIEAIRNTE